MALKILKALLTPKFSAKAALLVAGTFGFQPHDVHGEEHRLDGIARPIVGIDNRYSQDVAHGVLAVGERRYAKKKGLWEYGVVSLL